MRTLISLLLVALTILPAAAQFRLQGVPVEGLSPDEMRSIEAERRGGPLPGMQRAGSGFMDFDKIRCWYGEGNNRAGVTIKWMEKQISLGIRWKDGETMNGMKALTILCKNDPRLYMLTFGGAILGFGWDNNENGIFGVTRRESGEAIDFGPEHVAYNEGYAYGGLGVDLFEAEDIVYFGWMGGYWRYTCAEVGRDPIYSQVGAGGRIMYDGSWDIWQAGGSHTPGRPDEGYVYPGPAVPEDFPATFDYDGVKYAVTYFGGKRVDVMGLADGNDSPGDVVIPAKVECQGYLFSPINILADAFAGTSITGITLPASVEEVKENAFGGCTALARVEMPSLLRMKPGAFAGCTALRTVKWPEAIKEIPENTFMNSGLETVEIPEGVTAVGDNAFRGARLSSLDIPVSLVSTGQYSFADNHLATLDFPLTLKKPGEHSFEGNPLMEVSHHNVSPFAIPDNVFDAATYETALLHVPQGQTVAFEEAGGWKNFLHKSDDLAVAAKPGDVILYKDVAYKVMSDTEVYVTMWPGEGAFAREHYTGDLVLPETIINAGRQYTVTGIDDYAFSRCCNLESVTLSNTIKTVRYDAFAWSSLQRVILSDAVETMYGSFDGCRSLEYVDLRGKFTTMPRFTDCVSLKHIDIPERITSFGNWKIFSGSGLEEFTLPASIVRITGEGIFQDCKYLRRVDLNGYAGALPENMFLRCPLLEEVTGMENVTQVGKSCFESTAMRKIPFPAGVQYKGRCFFDCSNIEKVEYHNTVTHDYDTFSHCKNLKTGYADNGASGLFEACPSLTDVVMADHLWEMDYGLLQGSNPDVRVWFAGAEFLSDYEHDAKRKFYIRGDIYPLLLVPKGTAELFKAEEFFSSSPINEYDVEESQVRCSHEADFESAELSAHLEVPVEEEWLTLPEWLLPEAETRLEWCEATEGAETHTASWSDAGNDFSATLTGLEEGRTYRYRWTLAGIEGEWTELSTPAWPEEPDFEHGMILLNEDWYGTDCGSLNFYSPETGLVYRRAYRRANEGRKLGDTSQYAASFGGRLLIVNKQPVDGSGILTVADGATLRHLASVDVPGRDGRSVVGVSATKAYLGTSSGIYPVSLEDYTVGDAISKTETGDDLYAGQTGDMVRVRDRVYAAVQGVGLLVIDTASDQVQEVVALPDIAGVLTSASGEVYAIGKTDTSVSVARVDAVTLEVKPVAFSAEGYDFPFSWGSWRSMPAAADARDEVLYMVLSKPGFEGLDDVQEYFIGRLDLADGTFAPEFIGLGMEEGFQADGRHYTAPRSVYGTGLHVDPLTGSIMAVTCPGPRVALGKQVKGMDYSSWTYTIYNAAGEEQRRFSLPEYYWFPAMALTPDAEAPVMTAEVPDVEFYATSPSDTFVVSGCAVATDADSPDREIMFAAEAAGEGWLTATLDGDDVVLTPGKVYVHKAVVPVTVTAESNGRVASRTFNVSFTRVPDSLDAPSITVVSQEDGMTLVGIEANEADAAIYYTLDGSAPGTDSARYGEPLALTRECTVKAVAELEGVLSPVAEAVVQVSGIETLPLPDGLPAGARLYTPSGVRVDVSKPEPGIYILRHNGESRRVMITR